MDKELFWVAIAIVFFSMITVFTVINTCVSINCLQRIAVLEEKVSWCEEEIITIRKGVAG